MTDLDTNQGDGDPFLHLLRGGTSLLQQGRPADAVALLEEAYELRPDNFDAALNLSGAYILNNQFSKAVPILEKLEERDPENEMILLNLGAAYLGNPVLAVDRHQLKAIDAFKRALEINPEAPSAAYNIGLIHRDRGENEKAARWFRQALETNPQDKDAQTLLAQMEASDEEE